MATGRTTPKGTRPKGTRRPAPAPASAGPPVGRVELPGGHWAILRDVLDVTRKDCRAIDEALREAALASLRRREAADAGEVTGLSGDPTKPADPAPAPTPAVDAELLIRWQELKDRVSDLSVVLVVKEWDFDLPIAVESLEEIPIPVLRELSVLADAFYGALFPQAAEAKKDDGEGGELDPTTP